jgi:NAD(P)-dependent dehydrogenase (short-subunit alcohol dehydrogenase family)
MNWQGARVVVTGGASGIGLALATRAAASGAQVALVDIDPEKTSTVAASLPGARGYGCDVGDAAAMKMLAEQVMADLNWVDVVFANAGVGSAGKVERTKPDDVAWVSAVNILGPINTARAFVPLLREAASAGREAWMVITGSEHSLGIPPIGASNIYTISKHAALGTADVLRSDLDGSGVKVALLCPGLVATNIFDAKANRGAQFGGPAALPAEVREKAKAFVDAKGQDPALTAELCFEGLDRGDFLIITDPHVGAFARRRLAEIDRAISVIEQRFPA